MALFYLALYVLLAATACALYARLRSRAAACMALGLCAVVIINVLNSLFPAQAASIDSCAECGRITFAVPRRYKYTRPAVHGAQFLFVVGFVWFAAEILRKRGPHNHRMEADAATPGESEGRETE